MKENQQNDKDIPSNEGYKKDTTSLDDKIIEKCSRGCILNSRYYIDKSQPILSLFDKFCEAYHVKDIQNFNNKVLYAKILKKPTVLRIDSIRYIASNNIDNFLNPVAVGVVEIDLHNNQEEYIAIIYRENSGVSLGELIDKNEYFSDKYIIKNIIYNINEVLRNLHNLNIAHGSINLDNIYLTKNGIVLNECFSSPCGYNQDLFYEPISIFKAPSYAKNNRDFRADYYALGVVCLELVLSKRLKKDIEGLDSEKIYEGSYRYYLNNVMLTGTINKIIQGLLQDEEQKRFGYEELSNITLLKGFIPKAINNDFSESIYFNNKKIYNSKALAYEMSLNLEKARQLVYSGALQVFLQKFDDRKKLLKQINTILKNSTRSHANLDFYTKQKFTIAEIIRILGAQNVFSVKGISICFEKYAIGNLILHLVNDNEEDKLKLLSDIIKYQIFIYPEKVKDNDFLRAYNSIVNMNDDYVFTLLLALHKTFPELPYLGVLEKRKVIFSAAEILNTLEENCPAKTLFTDRYIIPFLCSRLNIDYFQKIEQLKYFSSIANISSIKLLVLFSEAQKECKINELPNLSDVFSQNIIAVMPNLLYSNRTKENFINQINAIKGKGNLEEILNVVTQEKFLKDDTKNYQKNVAKAKSIYKQFNTTLSELENKDLLKQKSLRTALAISYLLFSVAVLYIIVYLAI